MWPWGHLAVGYLLYSGYRHAWSGRPPRGAAALSLALGTQFPDLVDKPLAWSFTVLPSGRSLAHSLLTALVVLAVVHRFTRKAGYPELGTAFAVGYLTHLLGDAYRPLASGEFEYATFALWPLLPLPPYETERSFVAHFAVLDPGVALVFPLMILLVGFTALVARITGRNSLVGYVTQLAITLFVLVAWMDRVAGVESIQVTVELALAQAAIVTWVYDGTPGLSTIRSVFRSGRSVAG